MPQKTRKLGPLRSTLELIKLLRPKQWVKNGFVLAPLLFTGEFLNPDAIQHSLIAFLLFSAASSAVYILNDLHDVERDRQHPIKCKTRPLAAGTIGRTGALTLLIGLCVIIGYGNVWLPAVLPVLAAYLLLNVAYTFFLKHQPVIDIFSIATGFVLRVYAGAKALGVPLSSWMFITTLCLALYLAAIKRRQELSQQGITGRKVLEKYSVTLVDRYAEMSATGALIFYSLFVMSSKPGLVITLPLVLFGLFRYWYVVETLEGGESPTDALLADIPLIVTLILWVAACAYTQLAH